MLVASDNVYVPVDVLTGSEEQPTPFQLDWEECRVLESITSNTSKTRVSTKM